MSRVTWRSAGAHNSDGSEGYKHVAALRPAPDTKATHYYSTTRCRGRFYFAT